MTTKLISLANNLYSVFYPIFSDTCFGSISSKDVSFEPTTRLRQKLALTYLSDRRIRLNADYFALRPKFLAHTVFHEMTHLWLYDCLLDPRHTAKFYKKMEEFVMLGHPIDDQLYIHQRITAENRVLYGCPNCENRWYLPRVLSYPIYCGHCFDQKGIKFCADLLNDKYLSAHQKQGKAS